MELTEQTLAKLGETVTEIRLVRENTVKAYLSLGEHLTEARHATGIKLSAFLAYYKERHEPQVAMTVKKALGCSRFYRWCKNVNLPLEDAGNVCADVVSVLPDSPPDVDTLSSILNAHKVDQKERFASVQSCLRGLNDKGRAKAESREGARAKAQWQGRAGRMMWYMAGHKAPDGYDVYAEVRALGLQHVLLTPAAQAAS